MVRSDPINALKQVINAIEASDLVTPLGHISQSTRPTDASDFLPMLLSSYSGFHTSAKAFNNAEKRVCEIMRLEGLFDATMWRKLFQTRQLDSFQLIQIHDLHTRVHFATHYLPDLITLTEERGAPVKTVGDDQTVLALGVRPLDVEAGVDTSQLSHALRGIEMVYVACCIMNKIEPGHLAVQSWRGHPVPMFSVVVEQTVRASLDKILLSLKDVVTTHQGHRARQSLSDSLIASTVFDQLEAVTDSGVIDRESHDAAADMLLDGCLEMLSASVIPPGLPLNAQSKLDTLCVVADHELRSLVDDEDEFVESDEEPEGDTEAETDSDSDALYEEHSNVVRLKGRDALAPDDSVDDSVDDHAEYAGSEANDDAYEDDVYDEAAYDDDDEYDDVGDFPAVAYATPEDAHYDHDDALQIVVEVDGEPVEVDGVDGDEHAEALPAAAPDTLYVEPEMVTNKAFKRALKDLRKRRRR